MVISAKNLCIAIGLLAQQQPLIERLPPAEKVSVLMALLALVLVGITLVVCTMIGGRWARRMARSRPRVGRRSSESHREWRTRMAAKLPDTATSETMLADGPSDETKAE